MTLNLATIEATLENLLLDAENGSSLWRDPPGIVTLRGGETVPNLRKRLEDAANLPPFFHVGTYGAVGNGSTDDTSAIQAAMDAADSAGGGVILFGSGVYLLSSTLQGYDGVALQGVVGETTFYRTGAYGDTYAQNEGFVSVTGIFFKHDAPYVSGDLTLSNRLTDTSAHMRLDGIRRGHISQCLFWRMPYSIVGTDSHNVILKECEFNQTNHPTITALQEGLASVALTHKVQPFTGVTQANPAVVSCTAHGFTDGVNVSFKDVEGMPELNGRRFQTADTTGNPNSFSLNEYTETGWEPFDTSAFGAYTLGTGVIVTRTYNQLWVIKDCRFVGSTGPKEDMVITDGNSVDTVNYNTAFGPITNLQINNCEMLGVAGCYFNRCQQNNARYDLWAPVPCYGHLWTRNEFDAGSGYASEDSVQLEFFDKPEYGLISRISLIGNLFVGTSRVRTAIRANASSLDSTKAVVNGLIINANIFTGYVAAPVKLINVRGGSVTSNTLTGMNWLNFSDHDKQWSSIIWIGAESRQINISDNAIGGRNLVVGTTDPINEESPGLAHWGIWLEDPNQSSITWGTRQNFGLSETGTFTNSTFGREIQPTEHGADGHVTRHWDGTMEVRATLPVNFSSTSTLSGTVNLPYPFIDTDVQGSVTLDFNDYTADGGAPNTTQISGVFGSLIDTSSFTARIQRQNGAPDYVSGDNATVHVTLKGRWSD